MTCKAAESLSEQIAHHLAGRIIRGELKERERIQEQKITHSLDVSRGPVREALLILQRRHLIAIVPNRGAQVTELTVDNVQGLYALMIELYVMLACAVAERWRTLAELAPFRALQEKLAVSAARRDIHAFVEQSFAVIRAGFPFATNPYLQDTLENLLPAISRTYHLVLKRRESEMTQCLDFFTHLLEAVMARDLPRIRTALDAYGRHNCQLVVAALAER